MPNKKLIKKQPELDDEFKEKARKEIADMIKNIKVRRSTDDMKVQLDMHAGFDEETNEKLTLREILKSGKEIDFKTMSLNKKAEIVNSRFKLKHDFLANIFGVGVIDQERALKEVKKQSKIGIYIIESECKIINRVLEEAKSRIEKGVLQL